MGADNDYGHPAAPVIDALTASGVEVYRTDLSGDVLVVPDGDGADIRTRGGPEASLPSARCGKVPSCGRVTCWAG